MTLLSNRTTDTRGRWRGLVVLSALVVASMAGTAAAQDIKATVDIQAPGSPAMSMDYWMNPDSVRIDMSQGQDVSLVWRSGNAPSMLMIQHTEQRYMEWGEQQFQMMRQMMQRMSGGGGGGETADVDLSSIQFEPTDETATVGAWSASGVRITGMEEGQTATMWIASDLDSGLFELFARIGDALEAMQMPMLGGGMGGPQQQLLRFRQMREAANLPDGGVVRLVVDDAAGETTITLQALDQSAFADDPFAAPASYQKMEMPNIPE